MTALTRILIFCLILKYGTATAKNILKKCCAQNQYVKTEEEGRACVDYDENLDFSDLKVYKNRDGAWLLESEPAQDLFEIEVVENFDNTVYKVTSGSFVVLAENATIFSKFNNIFHHLEAPFCVEHTLSKDSTNLTLRIWIRAEAPPVTKFDMIRIYFTLVALFVSGIFLLAVLVVFVILPELRTVAGIIQMSCSASIFIFFMVLARFKLIYVGAPMSPGLCKFLSYTIYYFALSSYFWMNLMSFDIWCCFRKLSGQTQGNKWTIRKYNLYGWGMPLLMLVVVITLNELEPHGIVLPNIVAAKGWLMQDESLLLYLYVPMIILIAVNCVFFTCTAHVVWKLKRGSSTLKKTGRKIQSFTEYFKLSIVMGISWIIEFFCHWDKDQRYWYLTDTYNLMMGVFLFIILVCNEKVRRLLNKKFGFVDQKSSSVNSSNLSNSRSDSITIQESIQLNPTGSRV